MFDEQWLKVLGNTYILRREWRSADNKFEYVLRPKSGKAIRLTDELGRKLGSEWTQTDAGTFVGYRSVETIVEMLSR